MKNGRELPFRITVVSLPPGVTFRLQRGKDDLVPPAHAMNEYLSFDFTLRVSTGKDGRPNFLGPFAQGPPTGRFVYVNSGTLAGQADSCWTRRAKVPLTGIGWKLIEQALAGTDTILEAHIEGKARDGGPACATVPLLDGGWRISNP
ncbi:MAG: DUF5990 family protein [Thermoanaerobaculia bacterium]